MSLRPRLNIYLQTSMLALCAALSPSVANAQFAVNPNGAQAELNLSPNSPFRDPDIIFLEADQVVDNRDIGVLTAKGSVEARYQDRTLRSDQVVYNINTGRVIATGNVVLIDGSGATQFAEKIELTDQLTSGSAKDFTARFSPVGIAGAAYAVRRSDQGIDLYNAYYTACESCQSEAGKTKAPSWRIKARKVTQGASDKMIHYRDAVVEVKGIPILYLPYLAHPDPSTDRRSGWLTPYGGRSSGYGLFYEQPYYWALSESSEATFTPRVMEKVNPLVETNYTRQFHSGRLEIDGSLTYGAFFDNDGEEFRDSDILPSSIANLRDETWRSHIFARGHFDLTPIWSWGFGAQYTSDDFYLDRYDLDEPDTDFGLYDGENRRLVNQLYAVGQSDNYRYSASAYGFQSLRSYLNRDDLGVINLTEEDDDILPRVLPKIELNHYFNDPLFGGRVHAFGDAAFIRRDIDAASTSTLNTDYNRISAGAQWSKSIVLPNGIEAKPFAMARHDSFEIDPAGAAQQDITRTVGQVGVDARWTFIRPGQVVDLTLEPRVQVTRSFRDKALSQTLTDIREDGIGVDLDRALLWRPYKSTGFEIWQGGGRADVGVSLAADWDVNRASVFLGQSYAGDYDAVFDISSGLSGDSSDLIGEFELSLAGSFDARARLRYDEDTGTLRRIDTNVTYNSKRLKLNGRYYKIDDPATMTSTDLTSVPPEEISGSATFKFNDDWGLRYSGSRDIDAGLTRREELALLFNDDCTYIELFYENRRNDLGLSGNSSGFGIRVALLTLGGINPNE